MNLSVSIVLAVALSSLASIALAEPVWSRMASFDHDLSFEVPCASEEVAYHEEGAPDLGGTRELRCNKDGVAFIISVTQFPAQDRELAFDSLSERLFGLADREVELIALPISGRRTIADRGKVDDLLGQRALVEINPKKIALVMAAGVPEGGADLETQRRMIDRFFSSLQITS